MLITSIKIFDATTIIDTHYPLPKPEQIFGKNILVKKINLLFSLTLNSFYQLKENKPLPEDVESFQNVLSFAINKKFTMCAVGLDKGRIILIIGEPNLLICPEDKLQMRFLAQIEEELHITNLAFSFVTYQGDNIDILYATTTRDIYYYVLASINQKEEIYRLNKDEIEIGAYSGCIDVNENKLLIGSNANTSIIEYDNLERGPSWFFEYRKQYVAYFKNYIIFVTYDSTYSINIYDRDNRFLAYSNQNFNRITGVCTDDDNVYVFVENEKPELIKFVLTLKEKDNKKKFETFYNKNFYDTAVEYAKNLKYDKQKISEISKRYAEHLYSKGEYKSSIEQFILTINYLDPSYVIQKFLEKKKLTYLISYLEALDRDEEFKKRDPEEIKDYTALLLNCYIMEERTVTLNSFLKDRNNSFQLVDIQTVIDICKETNQNNLALSIAEKTHKIDGYLDIMIHKNNQKKTALEKIENEVLLKVRFDLLCKYGQDLIIGEGKVDLKKTLEQLISSIIQHRDNGKDVNNIKYEELIKIYLSVDHEKELSELLQFIINNDKKCPGTIIHRQIEIYLNKLAYGDLNSEEEKKLKETIISLIKNPEYKDRINLSYLYILFSSKETPIISNANTQPLTEEEKKNKLIEPMNDANIKAINEEYNKSIFPEGMIIVLEMMEQRQELLFIYIETKNYDAILEECKKLFQNKKEGYDKSIIWSLNGLVENIVDEASYTVVFPKVEQLLNLIIDNNMPLLKVLDILKSNKMMRFKSIKEFMRKAINKENERINKNKAEFEEKNIKLTNIKNEIRDIKIKCITFKPNKCAICTRQLSLPAVHFFCQHAYDVSCMNRDTINDMRMTGCAKCLSQNLIDNKRSVDNAEAAKNHSKFLTTLSQKQNKFGYTMEMLKEGIMVLGNQNLKIEVGKKR